MGLGVPIQGSLDNRGKMNWTHNGTSALGINCVEYAQNYTRNCTVSPREVAALKILAGCIISLIVVVIVIGNLMVIIAVVKDRSLKQSIQNRFILSLAVADLLLGFLIMPLGSYLEVMEYWGLGSILCDIWLAADVFLCTASTLSLVVVSLDRYMSVTKALEYPQLRKPRRVNITIAGIWITAALVSLPPLAGWKSDLPSEDDPTPQCNLSNELGYIAYSLTLSFYIPMAIILVAYCRICSVARKRSQHIRLGAIQSQPNAPTDNGQMTQPNSVAVETNCEGAGVRLDEVTSLINSNKPEDTTTNSSQQETNGRQTIIENTAESNKHKAVLSVTNTQKKKGNFKFRRNKKSMNKNGLQDNKYRLARGRERRATITIAIIVAGFMICWVPFSLLYLIDRIFLLGIREHPVFTVIFWMGYCNSAINPILYTIFNAEFREAFKRLLCQRRRY